ncbi:hypothetical protein N1851_033424 [Merluccius polli]|uniref:Uncharacterized protein n=1 Tax=Merluccius polli TaxID=89951 RepID=A0AA47M1C0_MERPO|nr:hypothetical protein N1851_033424 [Merluccius polli]
MFHLAYVLLVLLAVVVSGFVNEGVLKEEKAPAVMRTNSTQHLADGEKEKIKKVELDCDDSDDSELWEKKAEERMRVIQETQTSSTCREQETPPHLHPGRSTPHQTLWCRRHAARLKTLTELFSSLLESVVTLKKIWKEKTGCAVRGKRRKPQLPVRCLGSGGWEGPVGVGHDKKFVYPVDLFPVWWLPVFALVPPSRCISQARMRGHLAVICLLATTFALSVKSKPHSKHHALLKSSHTAKPTDVIPEEANAEHLLPTFVSLDGGSGEQEAQELSANANAKEREEGGLPATRRGEKSTAVLLSEEELVDLLNKDTDGDLEEEQEVGGQEVQADRHTESSREEVEITDNREDEEEKKEEEKKMEEEENGKTMEKYIKMLAEEEVKEDDEQVSKMLEEEEIESVIKAGAAGEEGDGSTDSELLADLDYASDADISQPLNTEVHPLEEHLKSHNLLLKDEDSDQNSKLTSATINHEPDLQIADASEKEEQSEEMEEKEEDGDRQEPKPDEDLLLQTPKSSGEVKKENQAEGDEANNDTGGVPKGKTRKPKRQRPRKHALQGDEAGRGPEQTQPEAQEQTKAKWRRTGKWVLVTSPSPSSVPMKAVLNRISSVVECSIQ